MFDYCPETGVFRWKVDHRPHGRVGRVAGSTTARGYREIGYGGRRYLAHRLAFILMGQPAPEEVDHINCRRADNRWCNLRAATRRQNEWNKRGYSKRGLPKGVRPVRGGYAAFIKPPGHDKALYLGYFKDASKAAFMYQCAAETFFGDFAYGAQKEGR